MEANEEMLEKNGGGAVVAHEKLSCQSPMFPAIVRQLDTYTVGGFTFSYINKLQGKWSGDMFIMKPNVPVVLPEKFAISTKVSYICNEGSWLLRETTAAENGISSVLCFKFSPTSDGILSVDLINGKSLADSPVDLKNCSLTLTEQQYGMQLVGHNKLSGDLVYFQLITIKQRNPDVLQSSAMYYTDGILTMMRIDTEKRVS